MKDIVIGVLLLGLVATNAFLFLRLSAAESKLTAQESKSQYWDKAVEILEDCLEYNTLGECKQHYPQYRFQ